MAIKISMGLPPEVGRRFVADMDAYHNEPNPIKQEEIAVRQRIPPAKAALPDMVER